MAKATTHKKSLVNNAQAMPFEQVVCPRAFPNERELLVGWIVRVFVVFGDGGIACYIFGDYFAGFVGSGFQDANFEVVRLLGVFGDRKGVGGKLVRSLDAGAFEQAADYHGFGGAFGGVSDYDALVGMIVRRWRVPPAVLCWYYYAGASARQSILVLR